MTTIRRSRMMPGESQSADRYNVRIDQRPPAYKHPCPRRVAAANRDRVDRKYSPAGGPKRTRPLSVQKNAGTGANGNLFLQQKRRSPDADRFSGDLQRARARGNLFNNYFGAARRASFSRNCAGRGRWPTPWRPLRHQPAPAIKTWGPWARKRTKHPKRSKRSCSFDAMPVSDRFAIRSRPC